MPNARTHDTIALISGGVLVPTTVLALHALYPELSTTETAISTALLVGSHLVCSYWLSPDLDLDSAIDNRWGLLYPIWLPYQWAVPHRHWFSHSGISALLRLLYLGVIIGLVVFVLGFIWADTPQQVWNWIVATVQDYPFEITLVLIGAVISDMVHTASDLLSTRTRRWFGGRRR